MIRKILLDAGVAEEDIEWATGQLKQVMFKRYERLYVDGKVGERTLKLLRRNLVGLK